MRTTKRWLMGVVLSCAVAGSASGGPLIDPTLAPDLPDIADKLPGGAASRLLGEPALAVGSPSVPRWDVLAPLGLGLGVSRVHSDLPRSVPVTDLLSPQQISITTLGLSLQGEPLLAGDGREGGLRPWVGLGPAVFLTSLADITLRPSRGPYDLESFQTGALERTSAALGLQAQAGLRYNFSKAWSIFGEYRLAGPTYGLPGLDGDTGKALGVHRFQGGLSIEFR